MSIAGLKVTLKNYLNFDYGIAFVISILIFCIYLYWCKHQRSRGQSVSKKETLCALALSFYLALLLCGTLLNRSVGEEWRVELVPFWSYRELWMNWEKAIFIQIIANVFMFVPWGILFATVFSAMRAIWCNVGSAMVFSFVIELLQLIFRCGLFEFDDMIHNMLGATIGYGVWWGLRFANKQLMKKNC